LDSTEILTLGIRSLHSTTNQYLFRIGESEGRSDR